MTQPPAPRGPRRPRNASPEAAKPGASGADAPTGDRIAKVLARAGVASRRAAEILIVEGRVAVNGKVIDSPALNIGPRDRITVDGKPLAAPEPTRVWLYHKPLGLVTSERDEKGRATVFDNLPEGMPRVMSVGRLDLNSEGLLLLTNDGDLKRRLELPSTGWLRKYRVRVNGTPDETKLATLRQGITLDGERFQPMMVAIDRQQGANAWLSMGIREGKNREIRRAMEAVGLTVNRLIRVGYGPFQLGELAAGQVEELRPRVLRDQMGLAADAVAEGRAPGPVRASRDADAKGPEGKAGAGAGAKPIRRPGRAAPDAERPAADPVRKSWGSKPDGGKPAAGKPAGGKPAGDKPAGAKSWGSKSHGGARVGADGAAAKPKSWGSKSARPATPGGSRPPRKPGPTR